MEALTTSRADPDEQTKGLLALGQALFDDRRFADAEARARRVMETSTRQSAIHLEALILLARIHEAAYQLEALAATLKEIDGQLATQTPGPSVARSWALFFRARVLATGNHLDEALPIYEQAIDMALISEGPLSSTAVTHRLAFAIRLADTSHSEQAQRQFDAAVGTLNQLGGAHEIRALYQTALFGFWRYFAGEQISYVNSLAILEHSRKALANASLPVPPWYFLQLDFMQAQTESHAGNVAAGWRRLDGVTPSLRQAERNVNDRLWLAGATGYAALVVGRHVLADSALRELIELMSQRGQGNAPWTAEDRSLIARNLTMQGRTREADTILDEVPQFEETRGEGTGAGRVGKVLLRARAENRLAAGRNTDAVAILQSAVPAENDLPSDWTAYRALLGEALCAVGRHAEGLVLLKQAVAADEPKNFAHAPWLAKRRALIGLCAAGMGDRRLALRYAAQAREDFVAQSEVSPYFKAPLFKLERRLGLQRPPV
jgi:tetratricopeptide (TPR) repeat protein